MPVHPGKILFVGLGGAGQRHLRIFRDLLGPGAAFTAFRTTRRTPLLAPDFSVRADCTVEEAYGLRTFGSLEAALDDGPELVVVSTPSAKHLGPVRAALDRGIGVFVEKPFSHDLEGFEEIRALVEAGPLPFLVSFQRRFNPCLRHVKDLLERGALGKIISASFLVASYVPAWHPYEDFRDLYAMRVDLGGGVLLTEIHELDLCHWYFGLPRRVHCVGGTFGGVALEVEDTAQLTLDYGDFSVQASLCFMQKQNRRAFEIAGTAGHVSWDMVGNQLRIHDYASGMVSETTDPDFANDTPFIAQARFFLDRFDPATDSRTYLDAAWGSLAIVAAARRSMASGAGEACHSAVDSQYREQRGQR